MQGPDRLMYRAQGVWSSDLAEYKELEGTEGQGAEVVQGQDVDGRAVLQGRSCKLEVQGQAQRYSAPDLCCIHSHTLFGLPGLLFI